MMTDVSFNRALLGQPWIVVTLTLLQSFESRPTVGAVTDVSPALPVCPVLDKHGSDWSSE